MRDSLKFTEKEILERAKKYGDFTLTWHYRVDGTRKRCQKLVRLGLLYRNRSYAGIDEWKPTTKLIKKGIPIDSKGFFPRKREQLNYN